MELCQKHAHDSVHAYNALYIHGLLVGVQPEPAKSFTIRHCHNVSPIPHGNRQRDAGRCFESYILCRLPVKSLLRFKSVSKHWFSLIQNPSFISFRRKYCSQTKESLLVKRFLKPDSKCAFSLVPANDTPILNLDIPLASPHVSDFNLIGSSNGLVCLSSEFEIMLCNPATREFRVLPQPPCHTCTPIFLGFSVDPKNNDYKVVRVAAPYETRPMTSTIGDERVQIYHVSTDSWREIDAMVPEGYQPVYRLLCSLNGVFYWVVVDDNFVKKIIAFHMFDELFEQEFLPEDERISFTSSLSILRDSLALVTPDSASSFNMSSLCSGTRLHIWLRDGKGVKDSWSKKIQGWTQFRMLLLCIGISAKLRASSLEVRRWPDGVIQP